MILSMLAAWCVVSFTVAALWVAAVYAGEVINRRRIDRRFVKACKAPWLPLEER